MKKAILILFFIFCRLIGVNGQHCVGDRYSEAALFDSSEIEIQTGIQFASVEHYFTGQNLNLELDVYYPDLSIDPLQQRPVILLIHGGAFAGGNRSAMAYECMEYARRGFVAVTASYRLGWNCDLSNLFVACGCPPQNIRQAMYLAVQDARAALRFIATQQQWGIDNDWIFIGGESAGSLTALATAIWNQEEAETFVSSTFTGEVGALDNSGNALPNDYSIRACIDHCGAVVNLNHLADNADLPIISFHDSQDCIVPFGVGNVINCPCGGSYFTAYGSQSIFNYQNNLGRCVELNIAPQVLPNHCTYPKLNLVKASSCFLKRVMCGFCVNFQNSDINAATYCSSLAIEPQTATEGCTYPNAVNFNPQAESDDGSCLFSESCSGDLNMDGIVGVEDVILILSVYGSVCPN